MEIAALLSIAQEAVEVAFPVIAHYYDQTLAVSHKKDRSPVTKADLASNQVICGILKDLSDYPILSEESKDDLSRLEHDRVWVVDPIDGTKEFLAKIDEFTVNVALIEKGRPIVGVIGVPVTGELFYASKDQGAYVRRNGEDKRLQCGDRDALLGATLAVSRFHQNPKLAALLEKHPEITTRCRGSALKYCHVADGQIDATLRVTPLSEWDIAASDCVLHEAGAHLIDFQGRTLRYNQRVPILDGGIIAGNSVLLKQLLHLAQTHCID